MPPVASDQPKPAILCLHGRGTSAEIFRIQTIRLRRLLEDAFEFVFLDAPFLCPSGPGVEPFFSGCGPFYTWRQEQGIGGVAEAEVTEVIEMAFAEQIRRTGRPFAGAMGFSQGGTVVAGVALKEQAKAEAAEAASANPWTRVTTSFFTVCLMSSCPPLLIGGEEDPHNLDPIRSHSLHVVGLHDTMNAGMSAAMANEYFNDAVILELDAGHFLPVLPQETERLALAIRRVYACTMPTMP